MAKKLSSHSEISDSVNREVGGPDDSKETSFSDTLAEINHRLKDLQIAVHKLTANQTASKSDKEEEPHFVKIDEAMAKIWPNESDRPCKDTWFRWKKAGIIPFTKIGRSVYYDPADVQRALKGRFGHRANK